MLNDAQKKGLDIHIDNGLPSKITFTNGSDPVLTILRAAEYRTMNHDLAIANTYGHCAGVAASDLTREAVDWAIKAVEISENQEWNNNFNISDVDLTEALFLLQTTADYGEMCDLMTHSWLKGVAITPISEGVYSFDLREDLISYEAAHWMWMANRSDDGPPAPTESLRALEEWLSVNETYPDRPEQILFSLPLEILLGVQSSMTVYAKTQWQLLSSMSFQDFDLEQFRKFWPALLTCAVIPKILFKAMPTNVRAAIPVGSREQWVATLTALTNMDRELVSTLLNFITYSSQTTKGGNNIKKANVVSQPLFMVGNEIALSVFLTIGSSSERNLLELVANKLPKLYDELKEKKEEQWSSALTETFRSFDLYAIDQKICRENKIKKGDIDLFVYSKQQKTALVVQLKWFLVERVKSGLIDQGLEGVRQARESINWIKENQSQAADLLGLTAQEINEVALFPLVVLKEGMLNGFIQDSEVPVLSGDIFDFYVAEGKSNLLRIWQNAYDKTFLPLLDKHYIIQKTYCPSSGLPFNGVKFQKHIILPKGEWNPSFN